MHLHSIDNPSVRDIQQALKAKGFDPGVIDGKMGPKTRAAIVSFQKSAGLKQDGIAGPDTLARLFATQRVVQMAVDTVRSVADSVVKTGQTLPKAITAATRAIVDAGKKAQADAPIFSDSTSVTVYRREVPPLDPSVSGTVMAPPVAPPVAPSVTVPQWVLPAAAAAVGLMLVMGKR